MRARDVFCLGLLALSILAACGGKGGTVPYAPPQPPGGVLAQGVITHVVVISEENRTYDDIFGGFSDRAPAPYPGGDGTIPATIAPEVLPTGFNTDVAYNAHDWYRCLQVNGFTPDAWVNVEHGVWPAGPVPCPTTGPPYNPNAGDSNDKDALSVIDDTHRATYIRLAKEFEISDNYFAVQDADSFAGHQFIVALQSRNDLGELISGTPTRSGELLSCGSTVTTDDVQTPVLNRTTGFSNWQYEGETGVCWNGNTFADDLETHKKTWRHYSTDTGGVFDGFINFAYWYPKTNVNLFGGHFRVGRDTLHTDLDSNDLPQFTWVKPPCAAVSDHPGTSHDPWGGSDWVASAVNWIGKNPTLWPHTVIFVVWDDWGGFYDHRTPPNPGTGLDDALTPGMRQPFIVISAYDRAPGAVFHKYATYASVLRFTEDLYGMPSLNELDGNAYGLDEYFDFSKPPKAFTTIDLSEPGFDPVTACHAYTSIQPYDIDR